MPAPHDKIISSKAKAALGPLNFRQKGRSRTWISDHDWWLGVVEFQPSSWSKGSYLNVAAHWLWSDSGHISFDFGGRISEFREYENDAQFEAAAAELATSAAKEAEGLLANFPSVAATADILLHDVRSKTDYRNGHPSWSIYHAGVASALADRFADAKEMFELISADPALLGTVLGQSAASMSALAVEQTAFRNQIRSSIERQRSALNLPKAEALFA
jgi:hypothetical protein